MNNGNQGIQTQATNAISSESKRPNVKRTAASRRHHFGLLGGDLSFIDCFFSLFLGFAFTAAPKYIETARCSFSGSYIAASLIASFAFLAAGQLFRFLFEKWTNHTIVQEEKARPAHSAHSANKWTHWFDRIMGSKHPTLITSVIIFVFWSPLLFMLMPGTCINDTWSELEQVLGTGLSNHHPVFDTLLSGVIILGIKKITGSIHIGMAVFTLIQAMLTGWAFGYSITYGFRKLKLSSSILITALGVYCLLPIYPLAAQTISKDALFSWLYTFFFIAFMELIRTNGKALKSGKFTAELILLVIFCSLTRQTGAYVTIAALILALFTIKAGRKKLLAIIAILAAAIFVLLPYGLKAAHIPPSETREKFSLPLMQTGRYVTKHPNDVTPSERNTINNLMGFSDLKQRYEKDPMVSDNVKRPILSDSKSQWLGYFKVWAAEGTRHPKTYIAATNTMLAGWFSYYEYLPLTDMNWHNQLSPGLLPGNAWQKPPLQTRASMFIRNTCGTLYQQPVFHLLFSYGFYSALIPFWALAMALKRKYRFRKRAWLVLAPTFLSLIIGCWLAPCSIALEGIRYLYPVVYTTIPELMWILHIAQRTDTSSVFTDCAAHS